MALGGAGAENCASAAIQMLTLGSRKKSRSLTLQPCCGAFLGKGENMTDKVTRRRIRLLGSTIAAGAMGALLAGVPYQAKALNLYNGAMAGNNLEIDLSTTISYTPIWRVQSPSSRLAGLSNANGSEGDLDFAHGLVSNDLEILPVLDIKDGDYGAHISGEAYLNSSFLGTNQNHQASTLNDPYLAKTNDFSSATRNVDGENARLLDAFVYGTQRFGAGDAQSLTIKIGRQTLLWGQSLFLTNNGIAGTMAPVDTITAFNNPNAQTQQIIEPVGQVVVTYQPNPVVTLQAYYQFEWEHDLFQGVGAYFSSTDTGLNSGQRILLGLNPTGPYLWRGKDVTPPINNGQFGASLQLTLGNYDVGFYALRWDDKAPYFYDIIGGGSGVTKPGSIGTYGTVYGRDIWTEGSSVSTTVGPVNVAGEVSFRQHMILTSGLNPILPGTNANSNPFYPTGNTWAAQASALYVSPPIPFDPGGVSMDGEIGMNHVLAVTANDALIDSYKTGSVNRSSTAAQFVAVVTPTYNDVLPNLQLTFPVGLSYDFYGRSMVDPTENNGTGSFNVGITGTYKFTWIASLTYNDEIGAPNPLMQGEPGIADRSYVLLNLQHSF